MTTPLRVLLVSPVPDRDPPTGDVTYTEELLRDPPEGVVYETYADALDAGRLTEHARRGSGAPVGGILGWWRLIVQAVLNKARRRGLLWREPFRFFSVAPNAYDLVHVHVFSVRWLGATPPVVLSNGAPQPGLYRDGYGQPRWRVSVSWALERMLAAVFKVDQPVSRIRRASAVVTFTDHLRDFYLDHDLVGAEALHTVPCPTEAAPRPTTSRRPSTVGFVARNFSAKGGHTVLEAWPEVRRAYPEARLLLAGSDLSGVVAERDGVVALGALPREKLMTDFFEQIDVFAYPTQFDGGSLVMQEALAHAIPTVTSDYGPMPEMIGFGVAGAVVGTNDAADLATQIIRLLDPPTHAHVSRAAADWFDARFSSSVVRAALGQIYLETHREGRPIPRPSG